MIYDAPVRWLIWATLAFACAGKPTTGTGNVAAMNDDERLIAKVREAVRTGAAVGGLEATIGKATFTTARQPLEILGRVELIPDADHPADRWVFAEAAGVAYWTRPISDTASHNPRVVGVVYKKDGSTKIFFAELLPP